MDSTLTLIFILWQLVCPREAVDKLHNESR